MELFKNSLDGPSLFDDNASDLLAGVGAAETPAEPQPVVEQAPEAEQPPAKSVSRAQVEIISIRSTIRSSKSNPSLPRLLSLQCYQLEES